MWWIALDHNPFAREDDEVTPMTAPEDHDGHTIDIGPVTVGTPTPDRPAPTEQDVIRLLLDAADTYLKLPGRRSSMNDRLRRGGLPAALGPFGHMAADALIDAAGLQEWTP